MRFDNNKICKKFEDFISNCIRERVSNGSLSIWGKEGEVEPPHSVMPITIEESKPRMCHDERFLNLWMDTPHVSFDPITDIPRYIESNHFQSKLDDKSGYDHILPTEDSREYFGLYWKGWFFVFNSLPFGWSPSAYVYHNVGLGASQFIRSNRVPLSQYIDDRHIGQLRLARGHPNIWSNLELAQASVFIAALVLVSCGYFIGLKKSVFVPVQCILFLGFLSDSVRQAFILPDDKKLKFAILRDSLIRLKSIPVRTLQRFAGKAVSFSLAVPAAKLFCREVNFNISSGLKNSRPVRMSESLKKELEHWKFLDSWSGFLPWRQEWHFSVEIITDASNFGWGGVLAFPDNPKRTRDYWDPEDIHTSGGIAVKEAKALLQTLSTFSHEVFNGRVDAYVDNKNLIGFWNNEGGKSITLSNEIKELFFMSLKLNIILNLHYVPSRSNDADAPSRFSSDIDCSLSDKTWLLVESLFGPHSVDMMAIPSNVRRSKNGNKLIFFSPHPVVGSSGINVFAQNFSPAENYYVFPPFLLIGPLLNFLKAYPVKVTLIAPDVSPKKYWWPLLKSLCEAKVKIGSRSQSGIINFPPNSKQGWHTRPLLWDLYAFRLVF